jgi:hypothetical protein
MIRLTQIAIAALFAAVLGVVALAPARATAMPVGPSLTLDHASKPSTENVQRRGRGGFRGHRGFRGHGFRHRGYGYRRPYFAPPIYVRPYPVYRRCWNTPRRVWNGYRYVRRIVRVCG